MTLRKIQRLFENGNVCVCGERGAGKDMLFANIINCRNLPYISNAEYIKKKGLKIQYYPLDFSAINCGGNTYKNFMSGKLLPYKYPYPLGVDVYITDVGVYMPSQYCNELNKYYKEIPTFMALSRHLGECNVHINVQNLNRAWDKLREQSRTYITCLKCRVLRLPFNRQLVVQRVRIYEKSQSCVDNVPALKLPFYMYLGRDRMQARLYKLNYRISHGSIIDRNLVYFNRSNYDTHVFRDMLEKGSANNGEKDN